MPDSPPRSLSFNEARDRFAEVLDAAFYYNRATTITRRGRVTARVVSPDAYVVPAAPEAGGSPVALLRAAAEAVRAANHATFDPRPVPGLRSGANASDAAWVLVGLVQRLPQVCEQLASVLTAAAQHGTLTGPAGAPEQAAESLFQAAETLKGAIPYLEGAAQALGSVGGWLSPDAEALGEDEDEES